MTKFERRQAPRLNLTLIYNFRKLDEKEVQAAIKVVNNFEKIDIAPFPNFSTHQIPASVNLSANGMAFTTQGHFELDDLLAINILLTPSTPPVRSVARVVGFVADPEGTTGYVRVNFDEIAQYNRLRLANFVVTKLIHEKKASV